MQASLEGCARAARGSDQRPNISKLISLQLLTPVAGGDPLYSTVGCSQSTSWLHPTDVYPKTENRS